MSSRDRVTVSFVVRLTSEPRELEPSGDREHWRGYVQCVQSGEELRFVHLQDLFEFIGSVSQRAGSYGQPHRSR